MNRSLTPSFANKVSRRCWMIYGSVLGLVLSGLGNTPAAAGNKRPASLTVVQQLPTTPINRPLLRLGSEGQAVTELQAALKLLGYYSDVVDGVYRDSTAIAVSQFQQAAGLTPDGITGPATWNRLFPSTSPTVVRTSPTPTPSSKPTVVRTSPSSSNNPASSFPVPTIIQSTNSSARVDKAAPEDPAVRRQSNRQNLNQPASTQANPSTATNPQTVAVTLPILRLGMQGPAVVQLQERLKRLGFLQGSVDGVFGEATQAAVKAAQQRFNLEPDGVVGSATWSALLQ
jgi:peptidoglycan hydrolase-like protein with peptidoglycan-binding domain